jgi:hypothetical protein
MPPDFVTRRVALLKEHLGIANNDRKRSPWRTRHDGCSAPAPGRDHLGSAAAPPPAECPTPRSASSSGAANAGRPSRSPQPCLEKRPVRPRDDSPPLDGSILALRKFTSSELLDTGFNISLIAQRQGHGPQVLVKHYAKARSSVDRKAAEPLGRVVHRG